MHTSTKYSIREKIKRYNEKRKLRKMDALYYNSLLRHILPFPPSFYLTHTPEERERIQKEQYERIQRLIEELE